MVRKTQQVGRIILPPGMKPHPSKYELRVASILTEYFTADVEFIARANRRTADFLVDGVEWELKSPTGAGKNNIQRQLQEASRQSKNVIIDASRSKLHASRIKQQVEYQFQLVRSIKRLLFISKAGKVVELERKV